jgi:MFS family permease
MINDEKRLLQQYRPEGDSPSRQLLHCESNDTVARSITSSVLDGVGAGIFGALAPLVIADIMCGTGRYNLAQGAITTVQGIGASLSGLAAGEIVDHFGYSAAFLTSAPPPLWPSLSSSFRCRKPPNWNLPKRKRFTPQESGQMQRAAEDDRR